MQGLQELAWIVNPTYAWMAIMNTLVIYAMDLNILLWHRHKYHHHEHYP